MRRFIRLQDGRYADKETGQVLVYKSAIKELTKEKETSSDLVASEIREIKKANGITDKKETHQLNWNNNNGNPTLFSKSYKVFGREVKQNMDIAERGFLYTIIDYLETETNRIVIQDKAPTNAELAKITGVSIPTISRMISSLKEQGLIKTTGSGMGREIYLNPYVAFDGKDIDKKTLDLFDF